MDTHHPRPAKRNRSRRRGGKPRHGEPRKDAPQQQKAASVRIPLGNSEPMPKRDPISFQVVFFDTMADARRDLDQLRAKAAECGQLNIVIRADGDMSDPALEEIGKLYVGAAWALIHDRRVSEGWYNEKH